MRRPATLDLSSRRKLDALMDPDQTHTRFPTSPGETIRLLRLKLRMTQSQLAKRAGIAQSHVAKIEADKADPTISTYRNILKAMFCGWAILPIPFDDLEELLDGRIRRTAERRVARVQGSMSLERQGLDPESQRDLVESEIRRLDRDWTPEIWDEE